MRQNTLENIKSSFWDRADKSESGCLNWKGAHLVSGYGLIRFGGKWELAHRVAWIIKHGSIPKGQGVLHHCDNPYCINPDHLFLGTQSDNNRDRANKGRSKSPIGEKQNFAKLDEDSVRKIRDRYGDGYKKSHLARIFKVDHRTIDAVVNRRTWKHVND